MKSARKNIKQLHTIGARLADAIERRGYKHVEFARKIGISEGTMCRWIRGFQGISQQNIIKITEYLDLPENYLATGEGEDVFLPSYTSLENRRYEEILLRLEKMEELMEEMNKKIQRKRQKK